MTSPAIKMAKKCRMPQFMTDTQDCRDALERFHARAQAQALREAAALWSYCLAPGLNVLREDNVLAMAEELEK